jgi:hypothetical protein
MNRARFLRALYKGAEATEDLPAGNPCFDIGVVPANPPD